MKLVKEHINEFERGLDPKDAMGIGMTPDDKIALKRQVPLLKRPSPLLGKNKYGGTEYSRNYKLWKLLKYIQDGEDSGGRRYKDLVKFYYGTKYKIRSFSSGLFNSINRYTIWVKDDRGFRSRPDNRYFLDSSGKRFIEKYKQAFDKKD